MKLIQVEVGQMRNFNYLLAGGEGGPAALVDPAWEVDRMLDRAAAEGLEVTHLLFTHTHHDHIEGVAEAWRRTRGAILVHASEAGALRARLADRGATEAGSSVRELAGGETIAVGDLEVRALHTPGHSPGATCYLVPGGLITGDTLFVGRCGRTDFPGSDPDAMYGSLRRLAELPDETVVYPGHNYADRPTSTIGREKTENVHLSAPDRMEFLRRRMGEAWVARIGGRVR